MRMVHLVLAAFASSLLATGVQAQQPAAPVYTQTLIYIKVVPGKNAEFRQFITDTSMKLAQSRANAGEIFTWTLLRGVFPAGQEARADYLISTIVEGPPRAPITTTDATWQNAGVKMSNSDILAKRAALSTLVASEMWRPGIRVGSAQKGHFLFLNYMKVLDDEKYSAFEATVWKPLAEEWVKQGAMSAWIYATKMFPGGTETPYGAYTVDIFPSWDAAFKARQVRDVFAKVHPGKNYEETFADLGKLRDLSRRELWEVVERVEKKK